MSDTTKTLITRDKLQEDLERWYNEKVKNYLNGEGRSVIIKSGTITKNSPSFTFTDIPTSYQYTIDFFCDKDINYISINTSIPTKVTITYDSNDINDNETINVYCRLELVVINGASITDFKITKLPKYYNYAQGYKLNINDVIATAYFSDDISSNVTTGTTFDPPNGTVLNDLGQNVITCSFHNFIDTFEVKVAVRNRLARLPYYFGNGGCAVVYNNEIHILGSNNNGYERSHYKWNGTQWVLVSTLPYRFINGATVVYNDEIHILGSNLDNNYKSHFKWDGTQWIYVSSSIPYNFYNGCAVVYNNEIHILGGSGSSRAHYKWNGTSWISVSTLPYDFCNSCAVVNTVNNEIHILGSTYGNYYTAHYKWNGTQWVWVSTLPYQFYYGGAVYCNAYDNNQIHILGGNSSHYAHYAWNGTSWITKTAIPHGYFYDFNTSSHAVIWNSGPDEEIVILGGYGSNSDRNKSCAQYDGYNWINY